MPLIDKGPAAALASALLFGASVPAAKLLLYTVDPVSLAAILYLGAGIGLMLIRLIGGTREAGIARADLPALVGAVAAGGVAAPLLLLYGLAATPASDAALLLNLEAVFTALLAWFIFHEHVDRRIAFGFAAIVVGGVVLSWSGMQATGLAGPLAIVIACLAWGLDNNLTRRISGADPVAIAGIKGIAAGSVNLLVASVIGASLPAVREAALAGMVGFFGYGVSIVLFVFAMRALGAARTGAYFGVAPFFGAAIALVLFGGAPPATFWIAAALMGLGVWLHASERHVHWHAHSPITHSHAHVHDDHHEHAHDFAWDGREPHAHVHTHAPLAHTHAHYPDLHHRHSH